MIVVLGVTIGNFHVVGRLGRGGMGEVFVGEQVSIQTRVAIKILHREISADASHVQRLFNEARIVSRIKHAGIVKIFDVGFHDGHAYLVMELLEGESLASRIARAGRFSATQIGDICRQIASTLEATHAAGVIHRDLKPDNIFLTTDHDLGDRERVKLLDFGIAKLSGTLGASSPRTIGTMGTPAYMAPEQWGESANVDWRADAYSLGCVAFEMACGQPPFNVTTIADACAKHLHATPPLARSLTPDLPLAMDQLIARLLAKDPGARSTSMADVARAFAACCPGDHAPLSVTLAPNAPTLPPQSRVGAHTTLGASVGELAQAAPIRRWRWMGGAGLAAMLVLAAAMVVRSGGRDVADRSDVTPATGPVASDAAAVPVMTPDAAIAIETADAGIAPSADPPPVNTTRRTSNPAKQPVKQPRETRGSAKPPPPKCDPPYVVDATGKRIYKPECLD